MQAGRQTQLLRRNAVAHLVGVVGQEQVVPYRRTQPHGAQRRRDGDEAVHRRRYPLMGAAQKRTGHGGEIQSAYPGQHADHVVLIGVVQRQRLPQHLLLPQEALVGQPAAPACHGRYIRAGESCQHRRRGGGVADTHLADAQRRHAVGLGKRRLLHAGGHGLQHLPAGHGVLPDDVAGAAPDLPVEDAHRRHVAVDAHIHHRHVVAEGRRHGGHTGLAEGHVHRLLQGHRRRRTGYALGHHAVVGGEHRHAALVHGGAYLPGHACQPDRQLLQLPQTARRLGQLCLPPPRRVHGRLVGGTDGLNICPQFLLCHAHSSRYPRCASQSRDGAQS